MKRIYGIAVSVIFIVSTMGCGGSEDGKDRSAAHELFLGISGITENYTRKISAAPDSATWAKLCMEFEDSLEKINFSVPADTDLLLSEGQNDTIHHLMLAYIKARDERFHSIMYPSVPADSLPSDSIGERTPVVNHASHAAAQADASHSRDN